MDIKEIAILLATYNGEKYIREQLNSLINQSYKDFDIYIRDDGSSDDTVSIIKEYMLNDSRIHLEFGEHDGACQNFARLLKKHNNYNYVMFCDQDDVWNKYKIEKSILKMKQCESEMENVLPILLYCDKELVDEQLNRIDAITYRYEDSLHSLLCQCHIYGCTMMLNKELMKLVDIPEYASMHDHWIALVAAERGRIIKVEEKLILYRQHNNNVTGGMNQYSLINKIKNWNRINDKLMITLNMCYRYSELYQINGNVCLEKYNQMMKSRGILRFIKALQFRYKLNRLSASLRGLYVLLRFKAK